MTRCMTFRLPDASLWSTHVSSATCVEDIVQFLSGFWKIGANFVSIWDEGALLRSDDKIMLCVNQLTGEDRILDIGVGCPPTPPVRPTPPAPPDPPAAPATPARSEMEVDIDAIDCAEQERIFQRIMQAQVNQNLRRAQALRPHRLGQNVRTIPCRIRGKSVRMIVDTGASVSLLYLSQVQFCSATYLIDTRDQFKPTLVGVGDHVNEVVGVIHTLDFAIGDLKTSGAFAVLDRPGDLGLLGIDWLNSVHATIRVADDSIEIDGHVIRFEDP